MTDLTLFWILLSLLLACGFVLCSYVHTWRSAILFCAGVGLLYFFWGGSSDFVHVKAYRTISNELEMITEKPELTQAALLQSLESLKLKVHSSHKGLARLASIYSELGQFSEGAALLEQAIEKSPKSAEYLLQWVYHQSFIHQGKLPEQVRARLSPLLDEPQARLAAMNMLAMDDYFKGNYDSAIQQWNEVLYRDESLTSARREVLLNAIANAKAKMVGSTGSGG